MAGVLALATWLAACSRAAPQASRSEAAAAAPGVVVASGPGNASGGRLSLGATAAAAEPALSRKVIRNAEMGLEADDPSATQRAAQGVAERHGGFVVSSETVNDLDSDGMTHARVTTVLRVPAGDFDTSLGELRGLARRVVSEKVTGQDVTEEYLDVEARLRSQRAVEAQFLEILKDARTVKDALEVQTKLGEVRGEIEKAEGRRRFLENQTSLSTVTLHVSERQRLVSAGRFDFGYTLRKAASDALEVAEAIVVGAVRVVGVMTPVILLIFVPFWLAIRFWWRRRARSRLVAPGG